MLFVGMYECAWVCAGVGGYAQVWQVCVCVCGSVCGCMQVCTSVCVGMHRRV